MTKTDGYIVQWGLSRRLIGWLHYWRQETANRSLPRNDLPDHTRMNYVRLNEDYVHCVVSGHYFVPRNISFIKPLRSQPP